MRKTLWIKSRGLRFLIEKNNLEFAFIRYGSPFEMEIEPQTHLFSGLRISTLHGIHTLWAELAN